MWAISFTRFRRLNSPSGCALTRLTGRHSSATARGGQRGGLQAARLAGAEKSPKRWKIISLTKSFHGRTLAMIAATGNPAVKAGFEPGRAGVHAG